MRVVKSQLFDHYFAQFEPRQGLIDPPFHVQEITISIREQRNGGLPTGWLHTTGYIHFHQDALDDLIGEWKDSTAIGSS